MFICACVGILCSISQITLFLIEEGVVIHVFVLPFNGSLMRFVCVFFFLGKDNSHCCVASQGGGAE